MAFNAQHLTQLAAFNTWSICTFVPQIDQIIGAPGLDTIEEILGQYSSIARTPSGVSLGFANEFHGYEAMRSGLVVMGTETWFTTLLDTSIGPFEMREVRGVENGVVSLECIKMVGDAEKVVAIWGFVKKVD